MKFARVIQATGNNPQYFPRASDLDIVMVNSKGNMFEDSTFMFDTPILADKPFELSRFNQFLDKLETGLEEGSISVTCLDGRFTSTLFTLHHPQAFSELFFR